MRCATNGLRPHLLLFLPTSRGYGPDMERDPFIPSGEDAVPDDVSPTEDQDAQPPGPDEDHAVEETGAD